MPGPVVGEGEPHAFAHAVVEHFDGDFAAAAVLERVARELAGGGHELGLVDEREALRDGALARELAHAHDVFGSLDRLD